MSKTIGILGGMGPRATTVFEQKLLSKLEGSDQSLPKIVCINDGSIPDRTAFLLGTGDDPLPKMQANLDLLLELGADIVCIPCNTAHAPAIFDRLSCGAELVNLPQIVCEHIAETGSNKTLLLATDGTVLSGTYQYPATIKGIGLFTPDFRIQNIVMKIIGQVKLGKQPQKKTLLDLAEYICASGADSVILGCTELSIVANELNCNVKVVDSLDVLAESLIKEISYAKR